jgi:hypothetical protein
MNRVDREEPCIVRSKCSGRCFDSLKRVDSMLEQIVQLGALSFIFLPLFVKESNTTETKKYTK